MIKKNTQIALESDKETISPAQSTGLGRQQTLPQIAARWRCRLLIKNLTANYNSQFVSAFIIVSTRKPKTSVKESKLVLSLLLLFSKFFGCDFLYQAGLGKHTYLVIICYANLIYTYPAKM